MAIITYARKHVQRDLVGYVCSEYGNPLVNHLRGAHVFPVASLCATGKNVTQTPSEWHVEGYISRYLYFGSICHIRFDESTLSGYVSSWFSLHALLLYG